MVASVGSALRQLANPRGLLALAAVFGVLSAQAGRGTLAYFTDTATSTGNIFTTGTVDLRLTDAAGDTNAENATASVSFLSNMKPGSTATAPIQVINQVGTAGVPASEALPARYSVTSKVAAGSNDLAKRLDLFIGTRGINSSGTCNSTAVFGNPVDYSNAVNWTLIYQGNLAESVTDINLIGDPAHLTTPNAHAWAAAAHQISGDRAIAGGSIAVSEYLCLRIGFKDGIDRVSGDASTGQPVLGGANSTANKFTDDDTAFDASSVTDNFYRNLSSTITFTFRAVQETLGT